MTDEQEPVLVEFLVRAAIENEANSRRFENFCNEIIGQYAGITVVPTSISWDMGRDGRAIERDRSVATATSIRSDVDDKMEADLRRMMPFLAPPARVFFCTSRSTSDYALVELERQLRALCPVNVVPFAQGLKQLVDLSVRWPKSFLKFYAADYTELVATLQSGQQTGDRDEALRLALSLFDRPDSAQMREGSYRVLILRILQTSGRSSLRELCTAAQNLLRLGRPLPEVVLAGRLTQMVSEGVIELHEHRYGTTAQGEVEIADIDQSIAAQVIVGRSTMRTAFEREIGWSISEVHFERIWTELRTCLADLFYRRGREMVQLVGSIIASNSTQLQLSETEESSQTPTTDEPNEDDDRSADFFFLDELSSRVAGTSSLQTQQEELKQATKDLFMSRTGEAFEWLVRACAGYVTLCSLGVEEASGGALANALRNVDLILDTDVALSLLCPGEPHHDGAKAVAERWPTLGARIYVSEAVLREVAHHAFISDQDYKAVEHWLPGDRTKRLRLISNAFARAFAEMLAQKKVTKGQWSKFRATYAGQTDSDFTKISSAIFSKYRGTAVLTKSDVEEHALRRDVDGYLRDIAERNHGGRALKIARDKASRDAETYAAMVTHLRRARQSRAEASVFLVSSHHRLTQVEQRYQKAGERYLVLSLSAVVYLLSLVPNVSVGIGAMETLLFGDSILRLGNDVDRLVLRAISESSEHDMPWAHRPHLMQVIKERLIDEANVLGANRSVDSTDALDTVLSSDEGPKKLAAIIAQGLDELAVDSRTERENRDLRLRNKSLEEQIELLRAKRDKGSR